MRKIKNGKNHTQAESGQIGFGLLKKNHNVYVAQNGHKVL